jgi:hypothetical protein
LSANQVEVIVSYLGLSLVKTDLYIN